MWDDALRVTCHMMYDLIWSRSLSSKSCLLLLSSCNTFARCFYDKSTRVLLILINANASIYRTLYRILSRLEDCVQSQTNADSLRHDHLNKKWSLFRGPTKNISPRQVGSWRMTPSDEWSLFRGSLQSSEHILHNNISLTDLSWCADTEHTSDTNSNNLGYIFTANK